MPFSLSIEDIVYKRLPAAMISLEIGWISFHNEGEGCIRQKVMFTSPNYIINDFKLPLFNDFPLLQQIKEYWDAWLKLHFII